jgi:hypothetical protein
MTPLPTRYFPAVSIILVLAVAPRDAGAQQTAPLAGATRPNLRVLQTLPEAQLFPVMNLVATSLGVRCDFCHVQESPNLARTPSNMGGWAWARDDKAPKRKAREMMQMVVELNANRFRGEHKVTCFTCHNGSTQPARLPPLPPARAGSFKTAAPTPLPSVDRVWTNYINAVGDTGRAAPGTGTIYSGWNDRPEGRYGKVEIVVTADRYRITVSSGDTTISQGLDGEGAWVFANGGLQRFSDPSNVAAMRRTAMRYRPLKDRPANLQVVGVGRVAGRDVFVATARIDSITTWTAYFDAVTGLLRREGRITETPLLPLQEQVDYDDYRQVNGVQLPFQVRWTDGAAYSLVTRNFTQIRHNVPVDEALLRPPSVPR